MIEYKAKNRYYNPTLDSVKLKGYVGELADTFFEERIFSDKAKNVIYREAEDAFKNRVDDETAVGIWQGEYWGKWMIGAARVARYSGSEELRDFIRRGAEQMLEYQRPDGYLGTYKNSRNFFPPTKEEAMAATGAANLWNWNIWCRKYTLWGMLECYLLLGDEKFLRSCVGMVDHLIRDLEETDTELGETGTFLGVASCSILKPLLKLYAITEKEAYLKFADKIIERWERYDTPPALIKNALSGKRIREWYPESNKWAKAYETMSCFDGILEYYRITGDKKYLRATEAYFDILVKHEYNVLFSVGFNDVFGDAAYDVNCATEPCDVIHFMRLASELFLITGKQKYIDFFELSAYTPLLASAFKDGRWGARALRGCGRHLVALVQAKFEHNHCCVNNMPRGFMNLAETMLSSDGERLFINLYGEMSGKINIGGRDVYVTIGGDFLGECCSDIKIKFEGDPLEIIFRIPSWSDESYITVNGIKKRAVGNTFSATLNAGSSEVSAKFDAAVKIIPISSTPELGDFDWKKDRWVSNTSAFKASGDYVSADPELWVEGDAVLIRKGAALLCRSKIIGNSEEEMFGARELTANFECVYCERIHTNDKVNAEYILKFSDGKKTLEYHVADFASATNFMTEDKHYFSIYF
ncbi:MAG: glycoside hydrolase family 127 protein [Clostridia bacterium]|nr:glycoside hydrolase family 127 protein [Clostridia bacterium]